MKVLLKKVFWNHYDHLGSLVLLNLLWIGVGLPWLVLGGSMLLTGGRLWSRGEVVGLPMVLVGLDVLWMSPPTVALFSVVKGYVSYRPEEVRGWFGALRSNFWRAQALGLTVASGTAVACLGFGVYVRWGPVGMLLAGVMLWTLWLWKTATLFMPAVLAFRNPSFSGAVKGSVSLAGRAAKFSLPFSTLVVLWSVLTGITGVGLVIFGPASASVWVATAFRELTDPDASDDEEPRGWRDIIRPWEA